MKTWLPTFFSDTENVLRLIFSEIGIFRQQRDFKMFFEVDKKAS